MSLSTYRQTKQIHKASTVYECGVCPQFDSKNMDARIKQLRRGTLTIKFTAASTGLPVTKLKGIEIVQVRCNLVYELVFGLFGLLG